MSGDSKYTFDGLKSRVSAVLSKVNRLQGQHSVLETDRLRLERETVSLAYRVETLDKVSELFRALLDHLVSKQVKTVEDLVTQGLQAVLYDQNLKFESELGLKHGKVWIDFYLSRNGHRGHPVESFGGGPTSLASLLLRLSVLLKTDRYPLLILDETLGAVSNEYTEQVAIFLKKLSAETGVSLLMITHKQAFVDYADGSYQGVEVECEGQSRLELKRHAD